MKPWALLYLVVLLTPSNPLQCYTCDKKYVDRFTKEEKVSRECSNNPATWSVVTCNDDREYCMYEVDYDQFGYDKKYEVTRGCAIPEGA